VHSMRPATRSSEGTREGVSTLCTGPDAPLRNGLRVHLSVRPHVLRAPSTSFQQAGFRLPFNREASRVLFTRYGQPSCAGHEDDPVA